MNNLRYYSVRHLYTKKLVVLLVALLALGIAFLWYRGTVGSPAVVEATPTPDRTATAQAEVEERTAVVQAETPTAPATLTPTSAPTTATATPSPPRPTPTLSPTPTETSSVETASPTPSPTLTPEETVGTFDYTVRRGDSLASIALRFDTTVSALTEANTLSNSDVIRQGQVLSVPGTPPPEPIEYVVRTGDTLAGIAARHDTTVWDIARHNRLRNPDFIRVGQSLEIVPSEGATRYVVRWGDTLWRIALRHGTTPTAIAIANNLPNPNLIFVGQVLVIP